MKFFEQFAAERAALADALLGIPQQHRQAVATSLAHRLVYLSFLNEGITPVSNGRELAEVPEAALARFRAFLGQQIWQLRGQPDDNGFTPDVLGALGELTASKKQTGTYYTPTDVTEYLVSSTLLPCLLDRIADQPRLWALLQRDPDRYLSPSLRSRGRLPTEKVIERDARRQRCEALREELRIGKVGEVHALVTRNLNIRQLLHDFIEMSQDLAAIESIQEAAETVRVLDPTCGAGAFLVAAAGTLEEVIVRCRARFGLADRFAVCANLIARNLHGVDLSPEAIALCRMRLRLCAAARLPDGEYGPVHDLADRLRVGNAITGFSWDREFPEVMSNGGFDVVLGNPPYLGVRGGVVEPPPDDFETRSCPDQYAWVLERSARLVRPGGRCAMIVPLSLAFSRAFASCRRLLFREYGENWFASFGRIPSALFPFDVRVRNTIHIGHKSGQAGRQHTTRLHRWFEAARPHLLSLLEYVPFDPAPWQGRVPKLSSAALGQALEQQFAHTSARLGDVIVSGPTPYVLYLKKTAYNWLACGRKLPPCFDADGEPIKQTQFEPLYFAEAWLRDAAFLFLNGKWAFAFWSMVGDDFHATRWSVADFPIDLSNLPTEFRGKLGKMARRLDQAMTRATAFKRNAGKRVGTYNLARCRAVTDHSDRLFAEYLGWSPLWGDLVRDHAMLVRTEFHSATVRAPVPRKS
jgi:hypothetical protein